MQWLRLYHDTITDEKWRVVANECGQPVGNVLAVWMSMLINASNSSERGTLEGWHDRYVAGNLGYPTDAVRAIREAMQGIVLDGDVLTGWDKRQRVSDDVAEAKRKQREKARQTPPDDGGNGGTGADQDPPRPNGHVSGHLPNVHGQSESVHGQTVNVQGLSMDCPQNVPKCPEIPLYLTLLPTPTSMQKEPLAPPIGGAGKKVVFAGVNFRLGAQRFGEWRDRYPAIPDFVAALETIDAGLDGHKNPFAEAQRQLLNQHQYWLKHDSAQKPKPKPHANRAGIRKLGGRAAA